MKNLLYFEATTWQRLSTLIETGNVPTTHTEVLKKHLEKLVPEIVVLRRAPAWRKRTLADQAGNVLSEIDTAMKPYSELLVQLREDEKRGRQVRKTREGLQQVVWTWTAVRRDARAILRAFGWREAHGLTLAHSTGPDPDAPASPDEGLRFVKAWGEATEGMSRAELREAMDEFFETRRSRGQG